ncbi:MAG TPA: hypothetical protein VGD60_06095 [Candidatus Acidoferrales bacterium]
MSGGRCTFFPKQFERYFEFDESKTMMTRNASLQGETGLLGKLTAHSLGWNWGKKILLTTILVPSLLTTSVVFMFSPASTPASAAQFSHEKKSDAPEGFEIYLKASEADVLKAVKEVIEDDTIQGTWIYDNDKTLTDAVPETSSSYYGEYKGEGQVFYKVRHRALAPRHFKESADIGDLTVRYVVQGVAPKKTRLQIDAVFVEDGNKKVHASDTTVETSEFADVQAHIVQIQKIAQQDAELTQRREMLVETRLSAKERNEELARLTDSENSLNSLQQKVDELHHKLEVRVKSDSVDLKAAPFNRAAKLASLSGHSELLVEIITDYWYGVETVDGKRGWVRLDQVEPLP